jgi:hypothetical protein
MRAVMEDFMVWAKKMNLIVHQNTAGKPTSKAFD